MRIGTGGLDMRKKNFWAGIGILTVCAALGLGGCQRENQKIPEKTETNGEENEETENREPDASQKPSLEAE